MIPMHLYVCHTGAGNEEKIILQCQRNIISGEEQVFSPLVERRKKIHGQEETFWSTLYPGYVFFETDKPQDLFLRLRFGLGKTIFGYLSLLRSKEYILPLEPEEEDLLRCMMDKDHRVRISRAYKVAEVKKWEAEAADPVSAGVYDPAAKIVITGGPLASLKGRIVRIDPHKGIAVVRTKLLGEERDVVVGLELLRKEQSEGGKGT